MILLCLVDSLAMPDLPTLTMDSAVSSRLYICRKNSGSALHTKMVRCVFHARLPIGTQPEPRRLILRARYMPCIETLHGIGAQLPRSNVPQ
jgi:hypothetical protein